MRFNSLLQNVPAFIISRTFAGHSKLTSPIHPHPWAIRADFYLRQSNAGNHR